MSDGRILVNLSSYGSLWFDDQILETLADYIEDRLDRWASPSRMANNLLLDDMTDKEIFESMDLTWSIVWQG